MDMPKIRRLMFIVFLVLAGAFSIVGSCEASSYKNDPEANMSAYSFQSFFDLLMAPFSFFDSATGISTMSYETLPARGRILFNSDRHGYPALFILQQGSVREVCRNARDGKWSADGNSFLCLPTGNQVKWHMAIIDKHGKLVRIIKPYANGTVKEACFSPNNPELIYFRGRKDLYSTEALYSIRSDDNTVALLKNTIITSFTISPDGTEIAYSALRNEEDDTSQECIWIMKSDGSNARKLTDMPGDMAPAWSGSSAKIAYSSLGKDREFRQIFIMDADGKNRKQVTKSGFHKNNPCWSPNGKKICYEAYTHGSNTTPELFIINTDGTGEGRLMPVSKSARNTWTSDGKPCWVAE